VKKLLSFEKFERFLNFYGENKKMEKEWIFEL